MCCRLRGCGTALVSFSNVRRVMTGRKRVRQSAEKSDRDPVSSDHGSRPDDSWRSSTLQRPRRSSSPHRPPTSSSPERRNIAYLISPVPRSSQQPLVPIRRSKHLDELDWRLVRHGHFDFLFSMDVVLVHFAITAARVEVGAGLYESMPIQFLLQALGGGHYQHDHRKARNGGALTSTESLETLKVR